MTTATHTPGPWRRQVIDPIFDHVSIQTGDGKKSIARVYKKADAHLIAAAPDLLEALADAVEALQEARYYPSDIERLRAVIAKAKGE